MLKDSLLLTANPKTSQTMEENSPTRRRQEEPEFDVKDDFLKACLTREKTNSRRFSASNLTSYREEARSFRYQHNIVSSTASSPGYTSRDSFDPSTYSFTAAIKALQARSGSGWECLSGNHLHSKWNEAERYICNPLSGQVPLECLSAKTLSGRSFATTIPSTTKSAPLLFSRSRLVQARTTITHEEDEDDDGDERNSSTPGKEQPVETIGRNGQMTRDVGTQSSPPYLSSSNASPGLAPPIKEIPLTSCELGGGEPLSFHLKSIHKEDQVEGSEKQKKQRKRREMYENKAGTCLGWGHLIVRRKGGKKGVVVSNTNKKESCSMRPWRFCSEGRGDKNLEEPKGKDASIMTTHSSLST